MATHEFGLLNTWFDNKVILMKLDRNDKVVALFRMWYS